MNWRMNKLNLLAALVAVLLSPAAHAATEWTDTFFSSGKYLVVVAVLAIIFAAIIVYLVRMELKLGKLEKELKNKQS